MWQIESVSGVVAKLKIQYRQANDWKFRILVTSDRHVDSLYSDVTLQKKHLDIAKVNGWPVIDLGDFFDSMAGRNDNRRSRVQRPEVSDKEEYFDSLVDYGFEFISPYKDNLMLFCLGNHETSVLKHSETNLLKRLVSRLNKEGSPVILGGYAGWLKVQFEYKGANGARQSVNIRYIHGSGGNSPVTKGVINTNRRAVTHPDAHIILSGHSHDTWIVPVPRERISAQGMLSIDEQIHCSVPSYKDETTNQSAGFAVEKGLSPKVKGATWLNFWYSRTDHCIKYDAERAR